MLDSVYSLALCGTVAIQFIVLVLCRNLVLAFSYRNKITTQYFLDKCQNIFYRFMFWTCGYKTAFVACTKMFITYSFQICFSYMNCSILVMFHI